MPRHNNGDHVNQRRRIQEWRGGSDLPSGSINAARRPQLPWYKTTKGKIIMVVTVLAVAGVLYYALRPQENNETDKREKKKDLARSAGLTNTFFNSKATCTLHHAIRETPKKPNIPVKPKNLDTTEIRNVLASKIEVDATFLASHGKFLQDKQFDAELVRRHIINYFLNQCNEHLVSLLNTPVKIVLTGFIDEDSTHGRYVGATDIIKIRIPVWKPIVASPNTDYPYDDILRFLRHEQWHSIIAQRNSREDCDPVSEVLRIMNDRKLDSSLMPVIPRNAEVLDKFIAMGDKRIDTQIGKLLRKFQSVGGFNHLTKPEQSEYSRMQEKFKDYVPRRSKVGMDNAAQDQFKREGVLDKIRRGVPHKIVRHDSNIPIYIDEIHYEYNPDTGHEDIIGTGYHVPNAKDKLNAIVVDTTWRRERAEKIYKFDITNSNAPFAKLVSEKDALTREMGSEVLEVFYPELLAEHAKSATESECQPAAKGLHFRMG